MIITIGKEHKGKSVEIVVLKEPDYTMWVLHKEDAGQQLAFIQKEVRRLISIFDSKPFTCKCYGCQRSTATRFSLAHPSPSPYWWCDKCSPRSMGCDGLLSVGRTYREAMQYAGLRLGKDLTGGLIRDLAEAKGLPKRVGEKQAEIFFSKT